MAYSPPPDLRVAVEYCWLTDASATGEYEAMPDDRVDVVLVCSATAPRFEIYGPATRRRQIQVERGVRYGGLRLRPEWAGAILGDEAWRAADSILVHAMWGHIRAEDAVDLQSSEQVVDTLSAAVRRVLQRRPRPNLWAQRAVNLIVGADGAMRVEAVAEQLNMSRRTLERVFASEVGDSPKHFARITRLRALCDRLRHHRADSWALLAAEFGYADQAHLVRDIEQLTAHAPTRLRQRLRDMPPDWV